MTAAADRAIDYLLRRIQRDPRLAYYFDPITESMELLTAAYAEARGLDLKTFRREYSASLKFEAPTGKHEAELVDTLRSALDNIQGIADDDDIPSTAIRERGRALLEALR